jgi:hypothetical protein
MGKIMKLKAPPGVGDPCVAGVSLAPCDGHYDVEPEVAALLIECFGFVVADEAVSRMSKDASAPRRRKPTSRKI